MGRAIFIVGGVIWVAALIAVARDRRARRVTKIAALLLLVAAVVGAIVLLVR